MTEVQNKHLLITGASGMIGSALSAYLSRRGFIVYELSRNSSSAPFYYDAAAGRMFLDPMLNLGMITPEDCRVDRD